MWEFDVVVTTASGGRYRHLLNELSSLGEFRPTEFLGVILGRTGDPRGFLETLRAEREKKLIAFQDLGRVIPIDRTAMFEVEGFADTVRELIRPYLDRLGGKRFYVRLERRGHKGEIVSPEVEREIDTFVLEELEGRGEPGQIAFDDPEAVIAVETAGDRLGVGFLDREMLERYDFVRIG